MKCPHCHDLFTPYLCPHPACQVWVLDACGECHAELIGHEPQEEQEERDPILRTLLPPGVLAELVSPAPAGAIVGPDEIDGYMNSLGWRRSPRSAGERLNVRPCHFCGRLVTSAELRYTARVRQAVANPFMLTGCEERDYTVLRRLCCCPDCAARRRPEAGVLDGFQIVRVRKPFP